MTATIHRLSPLAVHQRAWNFAVAYSTLPNPFGSAGWMTTPERLKELYEEHVLGKDHQPAFDRFITTVIESLDKREYLRLDYQFANETDEPELRVVGAHGNRSMIVGSPHFRSFYLPEPGASVIAPSPEELVEAFNRNPMFDYADWRGVDGNLVPVARERDIRTRMYLRHRSPAYRIRESTFAYDEYLIVKDGALTYTAPDTAYHTILYGDQTVPTRSVFIVQRDHGLADILAQRGYRRGVAVPDLTPRESRSPSVDAANKYGQYRDQVAHPEHDGNVFAGMAVLPTSSRSSRRWGIEIETGAGAGIETPTGWDDREDGSLASAYGNVYIEAEDCPEYAEEHVEHIEVTRVDNGEEMTITNPNYRDPDWCDYCGQIDGHDDYTNCREFVSPILTSVHSRGLRSITDALEGRPTTDSAGVHVHVESSDLTTRQVANLLQAYDRIEPLIEASYEREERGYCKRRSVSELLGVLKEYKKNPLSSPRDLYSGDRYVTVNLQALRSHGTIEFRAMGPVYNYDLLVRWATFCREMVNLAKVGVPLREWNKVKTFEDVENLFKKYGQEYPKAAEVTTPAESELALVG